ncbi:MAG: cytochrome c [Bacteroidales bacterium]
MPPMWPPSRASCFSCHSETNAPAFGGNLSLETYDDVSARADRILGAVRHEEGFTPMPQGGGTLTECDILTIEAWINQGKPQ